MCCDNAYTSKYRKRNTPAVPKKGECICGCKLVRALKDAESLPPTTAATKAAPIAANTEY